MNHPLLFSCIAALGATSATAQTPDSRPNVIFLVADDLGYGDLSCYGAQRVHTPHVDSIAALGTRFTDAHAAAATSTPSRYSLLTGQHAFRHPGSNIAAGNAALLISPEQFTIADLFKQKGYATAAIGKWHLGLGSKTGEQDWNGELDVTPRDIGFDYHYLMAATADRVPCVFIENGRVVNHDPRAPISVSYNNNFPGEPTGKSNPELLTKLRPSHTHDQSIVNGISRIGYMKGGGRALWRDEDIADNIINSAVRFMTDHREEPFFMYLCTNDVHVPRYPHERFRGKSPMGLRGEAILQFDYTIGKVTEALRKLGLDQNTLLVITSDNGPVLDDGYKDDAVRLAGSHRPAGPWNGGKYSTLEGGTAVPFIVTWPGKVPAGKVSHALVTQIDGVASMAAMLNSQIPDGAAIDSRNALDTWLGKSDAHSPFVLEMALNRCLSLRTDRWKYIEGSNGPLKMADEQIATGYSRQAQLFDISADRGETRDVSAKHPDVVKSMQQLLDAQRLPLAGDSTAIYYHLFTPRRENRYLTATQAGQPLYGRPKPEEHASQWRFILRPDGLGYDIMCRKDSLYLQPGTGVKPAQPLRASKLRPTRGWTFTGNSFSQNLMALGCGLSQINQGDKSRQYVVLDWGGGSNTSDAGCAYALFPVDGEKVKPTGILSLPKDQHRVVVENGVFKLGTGGREVQLYDLSGRRLQPSRLPQKGVFVIGTPHGEKVVF